MSSGKKIETFLPDIVVSQTSISTKQQERMSSASTMPFSWNDVPMPPLPASPVPTNVIEYFRSNSRGTPRGAFYVAEWVKAHDISVGDFVVDSSHHEDGTSVGPCMVVKVARVNYWIDGRERPYRKSHSCWRLIKTIPEKDIDEYVINEAKENNARIRWGVNGMVYV
tara:strand:- start:616 stop:1116 length:501 start_codon:yes stop_codon:yes gene_type:complete